jgi:hypothetical protein
MVHIFSYGNQIKNKTRRLLEALLAYENGEFDNIDHFNIQTTWQTENQLSFRTESTALELLTIKDKHDGKLTKIEIRESLDIMQNFLGILEKKPITTRGSKDWYFTLKLGYKNKDKNLEAFDLEWNLRCSEKSKEEVLPHKEHEIIELIEQGESATLEFKSSARWNLKENKPDKTMEKVILKTVAAFLNSEGGALLIGVGNDGKVVGLQHDYKLHKKQPDRDGYEQFLIQLLLRDNFGLDLSTHIKFSFHTIKQQELCQVKISKSPKPVYLTNKNEQGQPEEQFWIRSGNSSHQLTISKIYDYCKHRFG